MNEDLTNVSYWILLNGDRLKLGRELTRRIVLKNIAISLIMLSLQIYSTFIILVDWFTDLKHTMCVHMAFKEDSSVTILKQNTSLINQTTDMSNFGFGDLDVASQLKENLIESPDGTTFAINFLLKLFILFIILAETQVDAIQKIVLFTHGIK